MATLLEVLSNLADIKSAGVLHFVSELRGQRFIVFVGQKKAVAIAVRNVSGRRRWLKLNEWLGA